MATVDINISFKNKSISPNIADPFTITVTNNHSNGYSIKLFTCSLFVEYNSKQYQVGPEYAYMGTDLTSMITAMGPKTLSNNQFRSYQANDGNGKNAFDCLNDNSLRALQVKIQYQATFTDNSIYKSGAISINGVYVINRTIAPKVTNLGFSRCTDSGVKDPFGTKLLLTLKTSFGSPSDRMSFRVEITQNKNGVTERSVIIPANDPRLNSFYNGVTDSNMFLSNFALEIYQKYSMIVLLTDGYESSSITFSVPSAFVNVHMSSAAHGGVAFGKLCSATDNSPKFECEYPVYLASTLETKGNITSTGNIYLKNSSGTQTIMIGSNGNISASGNATISGIVYAQNIYVNQQKVSGGGLVAYGNSYFEGELLSIIDSNVKISCNSFIISRKGEFGSIFEMNNNGFYVNDPIVGLVMNDTDITLSSGIASPNSSYFGGGRLKVGKIGDHVYIQGSVNATPDSSDVILGTIPTGFRPSHNYYALRPCSGARIARLFVKPSGELILEWVRKLSDGDRFTTEAIWVDCNFDYWMYY